MENEKLIEYIENSFLKDLLKEESITDISFNGENIYYKDNLKGRLKSDLAITNDEAYSFIRQISNLTDSLFSYKDPILDVSVGKYRINATHYSISRKNREKTITFSIRIGFDQLRIKDDDGFIDKKAFELVLFALKSQNSIIISGKTGTGKTEFQKYILSKLDQLSRVITIDNINELETDYFCKNLDSLTWLSFNNGNSIDMDTLIKNALRSTPDWLIVGEVRGKEMLSLLNSAMSGHPTITTLHSRSGENTYNRMARMAMIGNNSFTRNKYEYYDGKSKSFHILNCDKLKLIEIGQYSFSDYAGEFELKNLPSLKSIRIGIAGKDSINFYYSDMIIESNNDNNIIVMYYRSSEIRIDRIG